MSISVLGIIIPFIYSNKITSAISFITGLGTAFSNFILLLASSKFIDFIPNTQKLEKDDEGRIQLKFEPSVIGKSELKGEVYEIRIKSSRDIEINGVYLFSENLMETEETSREDERTLVITFKQKRNLDVDFKVAIEGKAKHDIDVTRQFVEFEIVYSIKVFFNLIPVKFRAKIRVD